MRKFTYFYSLLLTALFLLPWSGMKAETLKIGSNDTYTTNSPVWGNKANNYVMSQIIYPATSLTSLEGKQITKLTFYTRSGYASNVVWNDMQICITERSTASFASNTDWEDISGLTPLYTGQIDATGSSVTLTLTSPYVYNGGNLLIDIRNTKKTNAASSGKPRWQATSVSNTVLYDYSSSSSTPSSWTELNSKRPDVQFTYEDAPAAGSCPKPKNLSASQVLPDQATFAWEQNTDETTYQWACVAAGGTVSAWNDLAEGVRTATVTGLTNGSSYDFHVRSYCGAGEGEQSESVKKNFTTSCPAPTAVTVPAATIGSNSAEMSWTGAAGITDYQYSVVAKGASANWTNAVLVEGATSTTITGLNASTEYDVYVRSYYNATIQSTPATKVTFKTACGAVSLPFNEAFSSIGCWTIDCNDESGINSGAFRFYYDKNVTQYLITPAFVASANQLKIQFDYWVYSASYAESFVVGYSTTTNEVSAFTWGTEQTGLTNLSSAKATYKETLPAGVKYVAIHYTALDKYALYIDDFKAEEYVAPSCANPTGLTVDNITTNSAQVSWTSDASSFALEYSNDEVTWTPATGTITNPFTLSGLNPDKTKYFVRVKAICGVGNESDWVSSNAFYTECGTKAFGWSENFASADLPACWEAESFGTGNGQWRIYDGQARYNGRVASTTTNDLTSPSIVLPDEDAMLQFYHENGKVNFEVGVTNGTTTAWRTNISKNSSLKVDTMSLSAFKNQTVNFIFRAYGYSTSSTVYAYIDDVTVVYKPVNVPTALNALPTPDGAVVTWSHDEDGPFEVRYSVSGADSWTTVSNVTTKSYTITGLTPGTDYDVQVRATISEHRSSDWTASVTFTPECSAPVSLANTAETYNSVELGWTGEAKALRYKKDSDADWTNVTLSAATSHTLTSLETDAEYTVQVQAACATADDKWSDEFVFTLTCGTPADLAVSGTTVSWTAGNGEAEWNVLYRKLGAADWTTISSVATNSYTFSGLEAGTTYQVKVASVCGSETAPIEFTTACPATYALPFTENFNNLAAGIPNCWDNAEGTTTNDAYKWNLYATGHEGKCVRFDSYDNNNEKTNILKTPALVVTEAARLEFWYKNPNGGDFSVFYSIDNGATRPTLASGLTGQTEWKKVIYDLPAECVGKDVIIFFQGTSNWSSYDAYIYLDDVKVEAKPTCLEPTGLEATSIAKNGATISWTKGATETAWKLQYKAESDADWSAEQSVATTPSFNLSGLEANTIYFVRVKADCGSGNESEYTDGTFNFRTECDAQPMPFVENFGNTLPLCWSTAESGADAWAPNAGKYVSANRSMKFNAKTEVGNYADLITPEVYVSDEATLKFQLWNNSYLGTVTGALYLNQVDADHKIMDLPTTETGNAQGWLEVEFDLDAYIGQNVKFIFRAYGNGTDDYTEMDIDDVEVKVKPCDVPAFDDTNVFVTADGAIISCAESNWSLRYRTGTDEWTEQTGITTSTYQITGLSEVEYEVQIRTDCSATRKSEWTASETFTPECLAPVDVTVSDITTSSATVNWTGEAQKLRYRIYADVAPFNEWTEVAIPAADKSNPFALSGLTVSTKYEVAVEALCGEEWSNAVAFTTWCDLIDESELPYNEDFSGNAQPACWQAAFAGEYSTFSAGNLYFYGPDEQFAILPGYDIHLDQLTLAFGYSNNGGSLQLGYLATAGGTFTELVSLESQASLTSYEVVLSTIAETPAAAGYLAFRYYNGGTYSNSIVDNIVLSKTPTCVAPKDMTATEVNATDATFTWTPQGAETAWNIQYKLASAADWDAATLVPADANPFTVTGLAAHTAYELRVQAACGGAETSEWSTPITVTTACDVYTMPFEENFAAALPTCWTNTSEWGATWQIYEYNDESHSGNYSLFYNAKRYNTNDNYDAVLTTPTVHISEEAVLMFWWKSAANTSMEVFIDENGTLESLKSFAPTAATSYAEDTILLDAKYINKDVSFIFRGKGTGNSGSNRYFRLDDVRVTAKPCNEPKNLEISLINGQGATFTWEAGGEENQYQYAVKQSGEALTTGDWNMLAVDVRTIEVTGLAGNTDYVFYVRSFCDAEHQSPEVTMAFTTACGQPENLAVADITSDAATVTWESGETSWNLQYKADTEADWHYQNGLTAKSFNFTGLTPATSYQVKVQAACGSAFIGPLSFTTKCAPRDASELPYSEDFTAGVPACWESGTENPLTVTSGYLYFQGTEEQIAVLPAYDINADLLALTLTFGATGTLDLGYMDAGVFTSFGVSLTSESEVDLAGLAPAATTNIAIRYTGTASYNSASINNVYLRKTPLCQMPTDLAAGSITANSASISWTAGSETAWDLQYKLASAGSWTDVTETVTNPFTLSGLERGTNYKVRVRANCGGETSDWTDEIDFTTDCDAITAIPFQEDFNAALSNCWTIHSDDPTYYPTQVFNGELRLNGGKASAGNIVVLPNITADLSKATLTIRYKCETASTNASPRIGQMTDKGDKTSFNTIQVLDKSGSYTTARVSLSSFTPGTSLAISYAGGSSEGTLSIDELRISQVEIFQDRSDITDNATRLDALKAAGTIDVILERSLYHNGDYATLCLPFNLSAAQLADENCPLNGYNIREYNTSDVQSNAADVYLSDASAITAGAPYFVRFIGGEGNISPLEFREVTISASEPSSVVVGDLTLFGTINPEPVTKDDKSTLFLSTGNELHYPSVNGYIKGFRAYFTVKPGSPLAAVIQRGGPVRIKDHKDDATAVENTNAELNAEKRLENGQVVIIRNGVKYTIQGQRIQ